MQHIYIVTNMGVYYPMCFPAIYTPYKSTCHIHLVATTVNGSTFQNVYNTLITRMLSVLELFIM